MQALENRAANRPIVDTRSLTTSARESKPLGDEEIGDCEWFRQHHHRHFRARRPWSDEDRSEIISRLVIVQCPTEPGDRQNCSDLGLRLSCVTWEEMTQDRGLVTGLLRELVESRLPGEF